jgi:hypothetical protein
MNIMTISWQITRLEAAGYSTTPSLAFSPHGRPSIAYYSSNYNELRFATLNDSGTWDISTLVSGVFGDCYPCLGFYFDQPAISYSFPGSPTSFSPSEGYAHLRGGSTAWDIQPLAGGWGGTSLAFEPVHQYPSMSYCGDGKIIKGLGYYQSDATHAWIGSTVDGSSGAYFNSLAFTPAGQPAIAYSNDDWNHPLIKYAVFEGESSSVQTVGPGNGWCSLAFTPLGEAAISYVQGLSHSAVMLAVSSGGSWNI